MNYRVSAASPTDELLTLRHIYSEVGEYASTILDREHLLLAEKCATRFDRVVKQLDKRQGVLSRESKHEEVYAPLSELSVGELYELYRSWPMRHREREAQDREHMTFYYEGKIVRELQRRVSADDGEQLKIDYCTITYHNELENLSFIFSLPVGEAFQESDRCDELPILSSGKDYAPSEVLALITLYSSYRDITERELLIEYVDIALDLMVGATDKVEFLALASELVGLGRKSIVAIPTWVTQFLGEAIEMARKDGDVPESELAIPLLTLQLQNGSPKLEREATCIVNRCYRRAISEVVRAEERDVPIVNDLYTAVTCADYVSRFNIRKIGKNWNELTTRLISSMTELSTQSLVRLLMVANEIEDYAKISADNKVTLFSELERRAHLGDIEARCYMQSFPTPVAQAI